MTSPLSQVIEPATRETKAEKALISAIVLNWNGKGIVKKCLDSLLRQTYAPLEVMVVDNGSVDGSVDYLKENFPQVNLVVNERNLGFCGGNNSGIRKAAGSYLVLVNYDAELEPDCIEEMMKAMEQHPEAGVIASKIVLADDANKIDAAGIAICPDGLSIGRGRTEAASLYDEEAEVFFASDCCCLYRKAMLDDIGLYDDDFFAYAEETDMGWRAQLKGWKCWYNPKAIVHHAHSASLGSYSPFKVYLVERNRIWVAVKNIPAHYFFTGLAFTFMRFFYQAFGAFTGRGAAGEFAKSISKWQLAWVLLKALTSGFLGIPKMLPKRRHILSSKRITNAEIETLFKRFGMTAREISFKC